MKRPIIQGGMGVDISTWSLASAVSRLGGLGTLSGTAAGIIMSIKLQKGDIGGHFRRALAKFPFPRFATQVLEKYFVEGGIKPRQPYKVVPKFSLNPPEEVIALEVCANFAIVYLAKEGHSNPISINYLEKIQMPLIYAFVGAMLAGVDIITMGAGIPIRVAGILDSISAGGKASYNINVTGAPNNIMAVEFDPEKFFGQSIAGVKRPDFLPIVSLDSLARIIKKRSTGQIQGIVVEGREAGGHNAPPRGKFQFNKLNEPIYSDNDEANWEKMRSLELPFWVGGGWASPEKLALAKEIGAVGIQAGSIFALCEESGLRKDLKVEAIRLAYNGKLDVVASPQYSPTGFPIQNAILPGTIADRELLALRQSNCDQGVLVELYLRENGAVGYRCPAEGAEQYLKKGGDPKRIVGTCCLCNGLFASTGLADESEPAFVTLGKNLSFIQKIIPNEHAEYRAADAMRYLL